MARRRKLKVLVGCEFSGIIRDEFIKRGHQAMSCDLEPTERPGPHYQGSVFDVIDYPWDLAILHPPCTHTAVSGAHRFAGKWMDGRQQGGVSFFMYLRRRAEHIRRICMEHPVSIMSTLWIPPHQIIQPWQFGHPEVKKTCLWLINLPDLVPTKIVKGRRPRVHHEPPGPDRQKNRSRTYPGIAAAMAEQWGAL